jgi:peroxiredoxin
LIGTDGKIAQVWRKVRTNKVDAVSDAVRALDN